MQLRLLFAVIACVLILSSSAHGQESLNMELVSSWNPLNPSESVSSLRYNDIWGYVDDQGREYAIIGSRDSIHFINVSDPSAPYQIQAFAGGGRTLWRDMKTYGRYAFAGSESSGEGLMVFDLQNLPHSVTKVYHSDEFFTRSHNIFIDTSSARLYAVGGRQGTTMRDMIILDISDPTTPVELGVMSLPGGYIHDVYVRNDTAYSSHGSFQPSSNELYIYDCTAGNNCDQIGGINVYPQEGYNHSSWLSDDGKHLIWADESHNTSLKIAELLVDPTAQPAEVISLDVKDLFRSKLLAETTGDTASIAHNPFIKGDSVYVSYYHDGLSVFDISDPENVTQVAYYDTHPENTNYGSFKGAWGCYPYLPSGIILASDVYRGLQILRFANRKTIKEYNTTDSLFVNPERGFYRYTETRSGSYSLLDSATLRYYRSLHSPSTAQYSVYSSLILRKVVLEDFVNQDISQGFLDSMQVDFETVRAAGLKMILKFVYTDETTDCGREPCRPYGDADKAQVLSHIDQLQALLRDNSDVIAVLQMGFIGVDGNGYYTDHFGDASQGPDFALTTENWNDRSEVLSALLDALPPSRMVQVRFPQMKQKHLYGAAAPTDSDPLTFAQAFTQEDIARIGHHNECFLSSSTDAGTYLDYSNGSQEDTTNLKPYTAQDSRYVMMGGQTCHDFNPVSNCSSDGGIAENEMERFHFSYLSADYQNDLNNDWNGICMDSIRKRLGYRLSMIESSVDNTAAQGDCWNIKLSLRNTGFAPPINPRKAILVLQNSSSDQVWKVELDADPRYWVQGTHIIEEDFMVPHCMPVGEYDIYLHLADGDPRLEDRPEYSIRLANEGIWRADKGWNDLGQKMMVEAATDDPECTDARVFEKADPTNIWVGPSTSTWNASAANWSKGHVPDHCDDVLIPSGFVIELLDQNSGFGRTLTVENGAQLIVYPGANLDIINQ